MQSLKEMKKSPGDPPPVMTHSVLVGTSFQTSCHKILPMYTHTHIDACTHTHTNTHTHMCRHTYTHTCMHTYIHTLNKWAHIQSYLTVYFISTLCVYVCKIRAP